MQMLVLLKPSNIFKFLCKKKVRQALDNITNLVNSKAVTR